MSDPQRLLEGGDVKAVLVASACADAPSHDGRARAAAALGISVGAGAVAMGAQRTASAAKAAGSSGAAQTGAGAAKIAVASKATAVAIATKVIAGTLLLAAASGGVVLALRDDGALSPRSSRARPSSTMTAPRSSAITTATATSRPPARTDEAALPGERATTAIAPRNASATSTTDAPRNDGVESFATTPTSASASPLSTIDVNDLPFARPLASSSVPRAPRGTEPSGGARAGARDPEVDAGDRATTSETSAPSTPLARELGSLDEVRTLLARHDTPGALTALDRHDHEFATGALRAEAEMLRVETLLAHGDERAARILAGRLLARDPAGPHARRLRSIAGQER